MRWPVWKNKPTVAGKKPVEEKFRPGPLPVRHTERPEEHDDDIGNLIATAIVADLLLSDSNTPAPDPAPAAGVTTTNAPDTPDFGGFGGGDSGGGGAGGDF